MEHKENSNECECGMCEGACGQCAMCDEQGGYGQCGMGCQQMYGMHCGRRYHLARWILGIVILVLVFVGGVKLGEFKEAMRSGGYGYRMMDRGYNTMPGYGMMQWRNDVDMNAYRYGMMQQGVGIQKQLPASTTQ